jgi:preprotein translocase subunit YajC
MKRLPAVVSAVVLVALLVAPAALAHDGGEGWYGETNDKVVTNAGFILIAFFPLFIFVMSMLQWRLDKRKERRKAAHKALARDEQATWRGGW